MNFFKKHQKKFYYTAIGLTSLYCLDRFYYASTFERNLRTIYNAIVFTIDYKLNFQPGDSKLIEALHERVAKRILNVCKKNGGLYIKFGQQISTVPVLPVQYAATFKELLDNAPAVPFDVVEQVFKEEFDGKTPSDIFETFSYFPLASASIAQVHKATLKDGTVVAVKIQKPSIALQIGWDMRTYRLLLFFLEKFFDLPLYWSADYIESHIRQETDFINEARNGELCFKHIQEEPELRNRVYVPKIHWEYTTKRILTAEWIDGLRRSDTEAIKKSGFSIKRIMDSIVDVFSDQIFRVGFVHCDPHPGNMIVISRPDRPSLPQVVLLDHGLYVKCSPSFKHDYAVFWKSLFMLDNQTLHSIAKNWGISDVQLFASATLQKIWVPEKAVHVNEKQSVSDLFDKHVKAKERLQSFLQDTQLLPKELIFIGRNMSNVRANNRILGSPVNRINRMANSAVKSLGSDWSIWSHRSDISSSMPHFIAFFIYRYNYFVFRSTLLLTSFGFYMSRFYQSVTFLFYGKNTDGFEKVTDMAVKKAIHDQFGVEVEETSFSG